MKSYTLNACPFCQALPGNNGVIMNSDMCGYANRDGLSSYVYCRKCKAHGPLVVDGVHQRAEAAGLWNGHKQPENIKGLFE